MNKTVNVTNYLGMISRPTQRMNRVNRQSQTTFQKACSGKAIKVRDQLRENILTVFFSFSFFFRIGEICKDILCLFSSHWSNLINFYEKRSTHCPMSCGQYIQLQLQQKKTCSGFWQVSYHCFSQVKISSLRSKY